MIQIIQIILQKKKEKTTNTKKKPKNENNTTNTKNQKKPKHRFFVFAYKTNGKHTKTQKNTKIECRRPPHPHTGGGGRSELYFCVLFLGFWGFHVFYKQQPKISVWVFWVFGVCVCFFLFWCFLVFCGFVFFCFCFFVFFVFFCVFLCF